MHYYSATIRLAGSLVNEVERHNLSAPEVFLLNALHGGSAIANLKRTGSRDFAARDHRALRIELRKRYNCADKIKHLEIFNGLFGASDFAALPTEVNEADLAPPAPEEFDDDYLEPAPEPETAKKRGRPAKAKAEATGDDPEAAIRESLTLLKADQPPEGTPIEELRAALQSAQMAIAS